MSASPQQLCFPATSQREATVRALHAVPSEAPPPAAAFRAFLESLGLDAGDPHLSNTPERVARAYSELFAGLDPDARPRLTTFPATESASGLVVVGGIRFYSMCAHHFLPFFGQAHIGYVPGRRLLGLSKFARALEYYARRPQVQEQLTEQTAELLYDETKAAGVAVFTEARHLCMEMRGVAKPGTLTSALAVKGSLEEAEQQRRFFERIRDARAAEEV